MIDADQPSVARMYDHLLGGTNNSSADREACERLLRVVPEMRELALANRAFLVRTVRYLARDHRVVRYLDHGSGLPTQPNVHQVAQQENPAARVVYMDNDPVILTHGRTMLSEDSTSTAVLHADLRDTDHTFESPEVRRLLEGNQPVAALFVGVFHCIPDSDDPWTLARRCAERLPRGSYLVISHLSSENAELRARVTDFMADVTDGHWGRVRSISEIDRFFGGLELVGSEKLEEVSRWRPDSEPVSHQGTDGLFSYGGVARVG